MNLSVILILTPSFCAHTSTLMIRTENRGALDEILDKLKIR